MKSKFNFLTCKVNIDYDKTMRGSLVGVVTSDTTKRVIFITRALKATGSYSHLNLITQCECFIAGYETFINYASEKTENDNTNLTITISNVGV